MSNAKTTPPIKTKGSAVITIDFRHYLVKCPKKALQVVEILNASQRVEDVGYNEYAIVSEPIDASMHTLAEKVRILPSRRVKRPIEPLRAAAS